MSSMSSLSRNKKLLITIIFAAVIVVAGIAAVLLNIRETQEGLKRFQVEIISERDGYHETTMEESVLLFLGEHLLLMEGCQYDVTTYGTFVTGWHGMEKDDDEQYWWNLSVNGENATLGVDEIPIMEGDIYTFTLLKGWDY